MAANPAAEKITRSALTGWLGKPLQELLPTLQLGKMAASGNTQTEQTGVVEVIGDRTVVVDRSPLFAADEHIGTVLTLHSPSYVERAFSKLRAHNQERTHAAKYTFDDIVAESPAMRTVVRRCTVLAEHSDATVLLTGPSGVGKELLAQGIHNSGARRHHPFIAVNCGAFTETLLESELFGYEEGAFTGARRSGKRGIFEAAHRGTIFLDEIAELPLLLQTRLLRVLQEREVTRVGGHAAIPVDVRVIAATHKDPGELMRQGLFREDLFYRISVLRISVPPLRDRPEDLAMLTRTLFAGALERVGLQGALERILETAGPVLRSHDWQGNVRELKNVAERAAMAYLEAGGRLSAAQFAALLDVPEGPLDGSGMDETDLVSVRQRKEKKYILHVLEQCSGNRDRAASVLGVSRTTLWRLLKRHGVV